MQPHVDLSLYSAPKHGQRHFPISSISPFFLLLPPLSVHSFSACLSVQCCHAWLTRTWRQVHWPDRGCPNQNPDKRLCVWTDLYINVCLPTSAAPYAKNKQRGRGCVNVRAPCVCVCVSPLKCVCTFEKNINVRALNKEHVVCVFGSV